MHFLAYFMYKVKTLRSVLIDTIDAELGDNTMLVLIGPYSHSNYGTKIIIFHQTLFFPKLLVPIFLVQDFISW